MGLFDFLFGKSNTEHEHRPRRRRPWQTKCHNCGHNVIRRHGRWLHKNYNPGLQPGEDGDDPNEFGYVEYTSRCKYGSCRCTRPAFRKGNQLMTQRKNISLIEAQSRIAKFIDHNKNKFDEKTFIHNLRGEIVHISHDVYLSNGEKPHEIRQTVRRALWDYSKRKFKADKSHINLEKYRPPHE